MKNLYGFYSACRYYFLDLTKEPVKIDRDKTPILLVHGYLHNSSAWVHLRERLKEEEVGSVFCMNLGSPFHSIEEYSHAVKVQAKRIAELTGRSDLILIGHSMGGVVVSFYTVYEADANTVKKVITLGSPLKGTYFGTLGIGECARQLHWRSNLIIALLEKIKESTHVRFINFGSRKDMIIIPHESAVPFGDECMHIESFEYADVGHLAYLTLAKVHDKVIESLTG